VFVSEIFYSIQGESTYAGWPCVFVRLTGCNLRCLYCDTQYAYEEGEEKTIEQIVAEVNRLHVRQNSDSAFGAVGGDFYNPKSIVEITGGEPMLQEEVYALMEALLSEGYRVMLETNGSLDLIKVDERVIRIIDVKCPGSGMSDHVFWPNLEFLRSSDEVKFVLSDRRDYQWAKEVIARHQLPLRCTVLLSAVFGPLSARDVVEWILEDHLNVRFQLQWHKIIWSPKRRGV
jgi:7-carboxy-7-deazaguanine synthase